MASYTYILFGHRYANCLVKGQVPQIALRVDFNAFLECLFCLSSHPSIYEGLSILSPLFKDERSITSIITDIAILSQRADTESDISNNL